eukprot:gene4777-5957_t
MTSTTTSTSSSFNIVVLISGNGSNLQAIIDAIGNGGLPNVTISAVISNKETAFGLQRASKVGIETRVFSLQKYLKNEDQPGMTLQNSTTNTRDRNTYGIELAHLIKSYSPRLVVLAGWMIILPGSFLQTIDPIQVINLHPALPGQFPGAHAIQDAFDAFKRGEIKHTGLMIHKVIEEIDAGEVILTAQVEIDQNDTLESLEDKMHKTEHTTLVNAIKILSQK